MLEQSIEARKQILSQIKDKSIMQEESTGDRIIAAALKVYANHNLKDIHHVLRENKITFARIPANSELGEKLLEKLVEKEVRAKKQETMERLKEAEAQLKASYAQLSRELSETKGNVLDNPKVFELLKACSKQAASLRSLR